MSVDRLTEKETAETLLGVSCERLRTWRKQGDGPPHTVEDGRAYYRRQDVIDWREHFVFPPGDVDGRQGGKA